MNQLRSTTKRWLAISIVFVLCNSGFSQERKLLGRVLDKETQKPMKNVNVIIFGTTSGTVSNHLGFFEVTIDPAKHTKLIASHVGYANTDVPITAEDKFKFSMLRVYTKLPDLHLDNFSRDYKVTVANPVPADFGAGGMGVVESHATFPGGVNNFTSYLGLALVKDISKVPETGIGAIFTIDPAGKATNITFTDSTSAFREHVTRALTEMPAWTPATQRQVPVSQDFVVPIYRRAPKPEGPRFSGFYQVFRNQLKYPVQARRMGIEGAVIVQFEVDNTGTATNVRVVKDIGADCGDEVLDVLYQMPPVFLQPLVDETGSTKFLLPVNFGLEGRFSKGPAPVATDGIFVLERIDIVALAVAVERKATYGSAAVQPRSRIGRDQDGSAPEVYNSVADALKHSKKAEGLVLVNKDLNSFPEGILKLEKLKMLDLEANKINVLPTGINALAELQELYLFRNELEALPASFGGLKEMKILGLSGNQLKTFPIEITRLEKLSGLDLSGNQISSLPPEIGLLTNLQVLTISNNSITSFPDEFYQLQKLTHLDVTGNPLDTAVLRRLKFAFPNVEIINVEPGDEVFTIVEESALPPGGMGAFYSTIKDNMKYPGDARKMGIDGKVFVEFVIDRDGSIPPESIKVVKGLSPSLDAEAVRVIKLSPKWLPGRQRGKPVKQRMVMPITFKLG